MYTSRASFRSSIQRRNFDRISRAAALLDETLAAWRKRPLGEIVYLFLDARYEKVRQDGQIRELD